MLRELSVTLAGRPAHTNAGSLSQPPAAALSTSVTGGNESPEQDTDDEEVMFDVKVEQGLSGECVSSWQNIIVDKTNTLSTSRDLLNCLNASGGFKFVHSINKRLLIRCCSLCYLVSNHYELCLVYLWCA